MSFIKTFHAENCGHVLDSLNALYFRGALESGDMPSKHGLSELIHKGWAETNWDEPKPHRLTELGKAMAKHYYDAKAESASELTSRSSFTVAEFKAKSAELVLRWMCREFPSVRDAFPDEAVFELNDVEYNPAYERRKYLITHPVSGLRGRLTFIISDRGTDCDSEILK
jgi:hypothetical protein